MISIYTRENMEKILEENWSESKDKPGIGYEVSEISSLVSGKLFFLADSESERKYIEALREDEFLGGNVYETRNFVFRTECSRPPLNALLFELKEEAPGFPKLSYLIASWDSNCASVLIRNFPELLKGLASPQ